MRMSQLFGRTLRQDPTVAASRGVKLLVRAGYGWLSATGRMCYLPLGWRLRQRVAASFVSRLVARGGQAMSLPPRAEMGGLWQQVIVSYRQLPCLIYGLEAEAEVPAGSALRYGRSGLLVAHSLHVTAAERDAWYREILAEWQDLLAQWQLAGHWVATAEPETLPCGVDPEVVAAHASSELPAPIPPGGGGSLELGPAGDASGAPDLPCYTTCELAVEAVADGMAYLCCDSCGYAALADLAAFAKAVPPTELARPLERVHTPGAATIEALAAWLGLETSQTAKAVFLVARWPSGEGPPRERLVFAVLRGDMLLSEAKLRRLIGADGLRPATGEEIRAIGAEPGFGSPIGIRRQGVVVVVDDLIPVTPNLVAGANEADYHFRNVNYGRDFQADHVADIALAPEGALCAVCGGQLLGFRALPLVRAEQWPVPAAEHTWPRVTLASGVAAPLLVASYRLDLDGLVVQLAEKHNDAAGLAWPASVAPFAVALVALGAEQDEEVHAAAELLYSRLQAEAVDVLYDDRPERAGVKFNDADLIGLPLRITVGRRALESGMIEVRRRQDGMVTRLPFESAAEGARELLAGLKGETRPPLAARPPGAAHSQGCRATGQASPG